MPKEITNPRTSSGLVDATGIKGRFPLQIDEIAVPTYNVLDLEQTPYGREATPCGIGVTVNAAGAGLFAAAAVRPPVGAVLEVRKIIFSNFNAGLNPICAAWLDAAHFGLYTLVASQPLIDFTNAAYPVPPASPYGIYVGSQAHTINRNLLVAAAYRIYDAVCPNGNNVEIRLPYGIFLDGTRQDGPPALMIGFQTGNTGPARISFYCREFAPKG